MRDYAHLNSVIDRIRSEGAELRELTPLRSTLEDVFVDLVKTGDLTSTEVSSPREGSGPTSKRSFAKPAARFTLVAYFALSTVFVLMFAAAVNLDVVDGALAGAKLFGKEIQMGHGRVEIDKLVLGFEMGFWP